MGNDSHTDDFYKYFFFHNQSLLTEGRFVDFPKYGQIIFLVGGAGSGKNFVLQNMIGYNGVNCDVDDLKTYISREAKFKEEKYKNKGNEFLNNMDFKDPDKVFQMHKFSKKIWLCPTKWRNVFIDSFSTVSQYPTVYYDLLSDIDDAFSIVYPPFGRTEPKIFEPDGSEMENTKLDGLLNVARQNKSKGTLPNIVLNITGKDVHDFAYLSVPFVEAGYSPKNIHVIWVLTPYKEASENNKKRDRVVPNEILEKTHKGVKRTMDTIRKSNGTIEYEHNGQIRKFNVRKFIDGLVMIIFNAKGKDSWIPNSKENPEEKDFRLAMRNADEEGNNVPKGIRHTNHGKLEYEDISPKALTYNPSMVDHVNKIVIKEIGKEFKTDSEIDDELRNVSKWLARQRDGKFNQSKRTKIKQERRSKTGGEKVELKSFGNFKNKVKEYTKFS